MSTVQHGHNGNWVICVNLLPTMVQVRVLLIYLDVLSIVTVKTQIEETCAMK